MQVLHDLSKRIAPGRTSSFTKAQVLRALELLESEVFIGRQRLGQLLGLSEGVTRTLIRHLRVKKLISSSKKGVTLTEAGSRLLGDLHCLVDRGREVSAGALTVGVRDYAVRVRGRGDLIGTGVEQRDAAKEAGALGATTLVFDGAGLVLKGMTELPSTAGQALRDLQSLLRLEAGDVVIIGSSDDPVKAALVAKAAAIELLAGDEDRP